MDELDEEDDSGDSKIVGLEDKTPGCLENPSFSEE